MVMTERKQRNEWGEHRQTVRMMRKREEKLRAIFLDSPEIPDRGEEWKNLSVRGEIIDDIEMIRILGEVDTWQYLPEDVADILFKDMRGNKVRPQDFDDVSTATIVGMAVTLMRLYLMGANSWTRRLMPKVLQVNREKVTRRMFMEKVKHGVDIDVMLEEKREKSDYESDDNFDFDSVDFDF
jgi:hypothetical protein